MKGVFFSQVENSSSQLREETELRLEPQAIKCTHEDFALDQTNVLHRTYLI